MLLPESANEWTMERRRSVLLHEMAHVKRRDCLVQFLGQLTCAAHWCNPAVWFAARELRRESERACDDLVLHAGTRPSDYAHDLLDMARALTTTPAPTLAAAHLLLRDVLRSSTHMKTNFSTLFLPQIRVFSPPRGRKIALNRLLSRFK